MPCVMEKLKSCVCVCVCVCARTCAQSDGGVLGGGLQKKINTAGWRKWRSLKVSFPRGWISSTFTFSWGLQQWRAGKHLATQCWRHWLLGAGLGMCGNDLQDIYLPGKNMAVSAKLKGVSILLFPWVTAHKFKIHLLPIQLSFIWQN